jgi:hypothetical protein
MRRSSRQCFQMDSREFGSECRQRLLVLKARSRVAIPEPLNRPRAEPRPLR